MLDWLVQNHGAVFTHVYLGTIAAIALIEAYWPRRIPANPLPSRWLGNLAITLLDILLVRALFPFLTVGAALWAERAGFGLLHHVTVEPLAALAGAIVLLDLWGYWQHYLLHRVPFFWRFHRVHHTDLDYDFSTGLRFHPIEAVMTTASDMALVIAVGLPPSAVALYTVLKVAWAVFAHSNVTIPSAIERTLRLAFVTPDLHRTHHSAEPGETMTNFGGVTPLWDRAFGTYRSQPAGGHAHMTIGLADHRDTRELRLDRMLTLPFRG